MSFLQNKVLTKLKPGMMRNWVASPTGPFTVQFYCGAIKWFIVITNIGDIYIPVERVSSFQ